MSIHKRPDESNDGIALAVCQEEIPARHLNAALESGCLSLKKESVRTVRNKMDALLVRTQRLMRWRTNASNKQLNLYRSCGEFSWSLDGVEWKPADDRFSFRIEQKYIPQWNAKVEEFVTTSILTSLDEPLAHELLREAAVNRGSSPRSSLVLAVAAAEVGFKQFASKKLPDAEWLLALPTQPLEKMLKAFPWANLKLEINNKTLSFPEPLIDKLKKAVNLRNELVHAGATKPKYETVCDVLATVSDMLYFLDALNDQPWAIDFVRPETLKQFTNLP